MAKAIRPEDLDTIRHHLSKGVPRGTVAGWFGLRVSDLLAAMERPTEPPAAVPMLAPPPPPPPVQAASAPVAPAEESEMPRAVLELLADLPVSALALLARPRALSVEPQREPAPAPAPRVRAKPLAKPAPVERPAPPPLPPPPAPPPVPRPAPGPRPGIKVRAVAPSVSSAPPPPRPEPVARPFTHPHSAPAAKRVDLPEPVRFYPGATKPPPKEKPCLGCGKRIPYDPHARLCEGCNTRAERQRGIDYVAR